MMTTLNHSPASVFLPLSIELIPNTNNHKKLDKEHWYIRDNDQLKGIVGGLKRSLKIEAYTQVLDTSLSLISSFLATQAGTAPSYFPIFSTHFGGKLQNPKSIIIEQDCIEAATLAEFVSLLIQSRNSERPTIKFEYQNRYKSLQMLGKLANVISLFQNFRGNERKIVIDDVHSDDDEIIGFAVSGNHLPNLNRYVSGDQSIFLGWAAAKSSKLYDTRDLSQKIIRETIKNVTHYLHQGPSEHHEFWTTLYIQLLLDLALITDGAPTEIQQAITLARQLNNSALIAHCQRFCNQTLGVSREALATLDDSLNRFEKIPSNSEEAILFAPSRLGTILNRTTTAFIASSEIMDVAKLEADYWEAKEVFPSYSSLGMLASSAAVGRMMKGHNRKAVDLLQKASLERSLPIDNFNIRANLICAQYQHSASYDDSEFIALMNDLTMFKFLPAWEYHKIRICLNMLTVSKSQEHREIAWSIIQDSLFWEGLEDKSNLATLKSYLIQKRYSHYLIGNQIGGQFGKFVDKSGLFLAIDKDWT